MANEALSEKVSVNINASTLSSIDLLVDNGYYSNRSDFINQALRSAIQQQQSTIDRIIDGCQRTDGDGQWFLGLFRLSAKEVETLYRAGKHIAISGYGVLSLDETCDLDKLFAVVDSIQVKGKVSCPAAVKTHYGLK